MQTPASEPPWVAPGVGPPQQDAEAGDLLGGVPQAMSVNHERLPEWLR